MTIGPLAYMDPGTGSLFLQLLLAGAAGLLVFVKLFWQRVLAFFGMGPKETEAQSTESTHPDLPSEGT